MVPAVSFSQQIKQPKNDLIMNTFGNFRALRPRDGEDRYLDEFFNRTARRFYSGHPIDEDTLSVPAVNVHRTEKEGYVIEMAVPGYQKSDFDISVEGDVLIIKAERKKEESEKGRIYTRREHNYKGFRRSFTLPEHVEEEKIDAQYENGMLVVQVPIKTEAEVPAGPKRIEIQ